MRMTRMRSIEDMMVMHRATMGMGARVRQQMTRKAITIPIPS
jgi:hypothetical protein